MTTSSHSSSQRLLLCAALLLTIGSKAGFGQPMIKGPGCVIPQVKYLYLIKGNWDSLSTMQLCVSGGTLADSGDSCYKGKPVIYVRVIWNSQATAGAITVNSSAGSALHSVDITSPLAPGSISPGSEKQVIDYNTAPATIICTPASGGGCTHSYQYQWQQSANDLNWINISQANGKNLNITAPLKTATYYRRKATETVSGTIRYSDAAVVFVNPQMNPNGSTAGE